MSDLAEKYPKYYKRVPEGVTVIDTYALNQMFPVNDPSGCILHARKKLLVPGTRTGGKSMYDDIKEARDTLNRWLELNQESAVLPAQGHTREARMSADRQLLELAAKAARVKIKAVIGDTFWTPDGLVWNSLTDDGDALRLAVKLNMNLHVSETECIAEIGSTVSVSENTYDGTATRRAIVCAAAEIGRGMP